MSLRTLPQGLPEPGIGRSTKEAKTRGDYGTAEPSRFKQGGTWKDHLSFTRPHLINARHPIGQTTRASAAFSRGIVPPLDLSYGELARQTNRFANVLQGLGVGKGDRLFVLAGRIPEPIATRIKLGTGQVLVTTDVLYKRKVKPEREQMPSLRHVLLDPEALELARPLRQQVDLDSMGWLNFLVSLHERFGVEIAEADYARLISLNDVVDYLQARLV